MKKFKNVLVLATMLVFFITSITIPANADSHPLDEIQDYTITVNMRPDGTIDIRYHVEWKVLDDTSEGPLEWVKIGNPNMHVDEITALSENIKNIGYLSDGGSYIRIDFDRAYYKNEIVTFDYTIHQSYMYIIEKDSHICRYSFTPGWFDEIEVKNINIRWNDDNVIDSTAEKQEDGYLIWNSSLGMGERLNASVRYNLDTFTTNENEQYTEDAGSSDATVALIFLGIAVGVIVLLIIIFSIDDYNSHGGFGGGRTTVIHHSSCVRSSCACASCACACACAGGGRAGCSKKDFYRTNLKIDDIRKELTRKE